MKRLVILAALGLLIVGRGAALADSPAMSTGMVASGPHGYDWLVGTWSCVNSIPSPMGGPATTSLIAARGPAGALSIHVTATNFELFAFLKYVPSTKTWLNPGVYANGDYSTESTQQSGKVTRYTGTYYPAAGATVPIRDTYTMLSMSKQFDLSEARMGGAWKAVAKITCMKR
jgi:hypothetical protein